MEYFKLSTVVNVDASLKCLFRSNRSDLAVIGVAKFGVLNKNYLTFYDQPAAIAVGDNECQATILVDINSFEELTNRFPNATVVGVVDPRAKFIDILLDLHRQGAIHQSSSFPDSPRISDDIVLGANVVISESVQIDSCVKIESGSVIGAGTWLMSGVHIGANTVIGATGINLYTGCDGIRRGFPHLAGVIIENNAQIGANCVVAKGTLSNSTIGKYVVIGNHVTLGHGVSVASNVWISSGVAVGGYTSIGLDANIGLGACIRNGITIGSRVNVGMGSVVTVSISEGRSVFGNPAKQLPFVNAGPNS